MHPEDVLDVPRDARSWRRLIMRHIAHPIEAFSLWLRAVIGHRGRWQVTCHGHRSAHLAPNAEARAPKPTEPHASKRWLPERSPHPQKKMGTGKSQQAASQRPAGQRVLACRLPAAALLAPGAQLVCVCVCAHVMSNVLVCTCLLPSTDTQPTNTRQASCPILHFTSDHLRMPCDCRAACYMLRVTCLK